MASKKTSIYKKDMGLKGSVTLTLNEDERMMICEALAKAAPQEVDIVPIALLMDRICKGA